MNLLLLSLRVFFLPLVPAKNRRSTKSEALVIQAPEHQRVPDGRIIQRKVIGCLPGSVARLGIGTGREQSFDNSRILVEAGSKVQRCPGVSSANVNLSTTGQQRFRHGNGLVAGGRVQRSRTVASADMHVSPGQKQSLDDGRILVPGSPMQRRCTDIVAGVDARTRCDQSLNDSRVFTEVRN